MTTQKKVGILGSGDVAKALGKGFASRGYDVMLGTRDSAKLAEWKSTTPGKVAVGSFAQAAGHGELIVISTHGDGTESAIDLAGVANFAGKLVVDTTNPLDLSKGQYPVLFVGTSDSLGERVQRKLPHSKVVKCFNTVSCLQMIDPKFKEGTPPMFICGNDAGAKQQVEAILKEMGWPGALDVGTIDGSRWLEAIVPLWVRVGATLGTWMHACKVVQ